MKNKNILSAAIPLLITTLVFSSISTFAHDADNNAVTTPFQCGSQDAPSLFVLNTLYANTTSPYPVELWHDRDNNQINIFELAREIKSIANHKENIFSNDTHGTPAFEILLQRLAQLEDIADRALLMEADKWKPDYVNELMKHIIGIRYAGISELIPTALDPKNCKAKMPSKYAYVKLFSPAVDPCDEKGQHWSALSSNIRESNNGRPCIANYMESYKTNIELIRNWWKEQIFVGGGICATVRDFYAKQRTLLFDSYYKTSPLEESAQKEFATALTIWHAYVQEVLSKSQFYHNNQANKQVCLIRTIGLNSLMSNKITHFDIDYTMPNAVYDSFSLINIFQKQYTGKGIIHSLVPHHRIIHLYSLLAEKYPAMEETEVLVLSGPDLPFDYFYNTDERLYHVQNRLKNGEELCNFWPELENLELIKNLENNPNKFLCLDKETSKKYIITEYTKEEHTRADFQADLFYDYIESSNVLESRIYETSEGPIKVSISPENVQTLGDVYSKANETEKKRLRDEISRAFVVDALLANTNAIGQNMENILVTNDGQIIRANNSASFGYNNEGNQSWDPSPMTLWTLRDSNINSINAEIFADVDIYDLADSIIPSNQSNVENGLFCFTPSKDSKFAKELNCVYKIDWYEKISDRPRKKRPLAHAPEPLEAQIATRLRAFTKVAEKALEMQAQGISSQDADIQLRQWAESQDWGTAF